MCSGRMWSSSHIRRAKLRACTLLCWLLNPSTAVDERLIRVRDDLAVEVKRNRLLIRRGNAAVEVLPGEIRHLVNALAEGAVRLVGQKDEEG